MATPRIPYVQKSLICTGSNSVTFADGPDTRYVSTYVIQITGTWTATLGFDVTLDSTTWFDALATPSDSATGATTTSGNGVWYIRGGVDNVRVTVDATGTGTAVVTCRKLTG